MVIFSSNTGMYTMIKVKRCDTKKAPPLYLNAKAGKHKILPKLMAVPMFAQRKDVWELYVSQVLEDGLFSLAIVNRYTSLDFLNVFLPSMLLPQKLIYSKKRG
eukprot:11639148-Ditylum_brightwellii.AAC.1